MAALSARSVPRVTVAQWNVLVTVYHGHATTTEVARYIAIDPGAVSRLVDRLPARAW
jgi:DNA-binding MarR family transcriptional regulator